MHTMRLLALPCLAAALVLGGCDDDGDENGGFLTAPEPPPAGGSAFDADCEDDDRAPFVATIGATPDILWPPDHRMVPVTVTTRAEDDCDPLDIRIVDVESDEPVNGLGDGDTSPDWEITGRMTVHLRAERSGLGDGRTYTIRVRYLDGVDNEIHEHVRVRVPHDQGRR